MAHDVGLSVVIPLYNKGHTVGATLSSVARQGTQPDEVIVVDDGSTDHGCEIVEEMMRVLPQLRLFSQTNLGVSAARNAGAQQSRGEYVAFLDADDQWDPKYLGRMRALIDDFADRADVFCLPYRVQEDGITREPKVALPEGYRGIVNGFVSVYASGFGLIHSSSVCFRKDFFFALGGFPPDATSGQDVYLWLRAGIEGTVACHNVRSVCVKKEAGTGNQRRSIAAPYYVTHFKDRLHSLRDQDRRALKRFLIRSVIAKWGSATIRNDPAYRTEMQSLLRKLSYPWYLALRACGALPGSWIRRLRLAKRRIY